MPRFLTVLLRGFIAFVLTAAPITLLQPTARAADHNWLRVGQTLFAGQGLVSDSGLVRLIMQNDGNLVVYGGGKAIWDTGTQGLGGVKLTMQGDGNLVMYTAADKWVWQSRTKDTDSNIAAIQDDGNFVVYGPGGNPRWSTRVFWGPTQLLTGQSIGINGILKSANNKYILRFTSSGNLELRDPTNTTRWSSNTAGKGGVRLIMQSDGNLVMYNASNGWVWQTRTSRTSANQAILQNDGNFVVYNSGPPTAFWWTGKLDAPTPPPPSKADLVVSWAQTQTGKPYVFGTAGPDTYDCSGLVLAAYSRVGIRLSHSTYAQYSNETTAVPVGQQKPGDLIFYHFDSRGPGHVALYIGGGNVIHAPHTGEVVKVVPITAPGAYRVGRVLNN